METSSQSRGSSAADRECVLSDSVLLRICRAPENSENITPKWLANLRRVAHVVDLMRSRPDAALEQCMTLLASLLGQLPHLGPVQLPFGYQGPPLRSPGWVERNALERTGKQLVGLVWPQSDPEAVADAVQKAISKAIRLGFLEAQEYDAWRPGMRSGSGWRWALAATPYGLTKARRLLGVIVNSEAYVPNAGGSSNAATNGAGKRPLVSLGEAGAPSFVLGKQKKPLTDGQRAVVATLIKAGDERMLISQEGRAYRRDVCALLGGNGPRRPPSGGRIALCMDAFPPDRRRRDLDNLQKPVLDALEHAGVYEDDSQIDLLVTRRREPVKRGRLEVRLDDLPLHRCPLCGALINPENN